MSRNRDVNADTALERFHGYFELAPHGVFVTDVRGRCLEANPAFCRITGYTLEELAQLTISDLRPPDSPELGLESLSALLDSGRGEGEFSFVGKTGRRRWWSVTAARLDDGHCLGFATDITDQKNAADEFRLERDLRQQLLDAAPVIVLMLDLSGGILYFNPFTAALLGDSLDAMRGQDWFHECVSESDRERSRNAFQSSLAGQPTRSFRNHIVSRSSETFAIEWCDQCLLGARGEVVGMLAIGNNVTQRQQQEEALRASERRLRQTIDACFGFIGLMELDGTLIEINRPPLEAAGLRPEDVLGKKGWETEWWSFDPAAQQRLRDAIERAARGETVRFESPIRAQNDTRLHVDVAVGPLRNEHDAITGLVGFSVDVTERRRSEAALRHKDQALQQSISAVVFSDSHGRLREVNPAFLKLFGYETQEEVLGLHAGAFCADPAIAEVVIQELHERGQWLGEIRAKRRDGSYRDVQVTATLLRDAEGLPLTLMGSMIDVTDRILHETALQKSEAKYRSLIEGARDMIFRMSIPDGRYEYVSPAAEQVVGYSAAEMLAEPLLISRVIHPCFREFFEREWDKVCRGIVEPYFEYCVVDPQGHTLWISQSTVGVLDDSGAIIAIEGVCRNVTEFKRAEQLLRENEMRLRAILDSTPDCVKVLDSDCRLLEVNRAGLRMFEVNSVEDIRGKDLSTGLPPEYAAAFRQSIADACVGTQTRVEYEAVGRKGTRLWLEQYAVGLRLSGESDRPCQVLSVARDITERRRIENALRASEERYRTLFNLMTEGMSLHEIVLDDDGRPIDYIYLDVNPAFERLLGERREEVVGRRQSEHPSADTAFWIQRYGEVALTGQPLRMEYVNPESGRHWLVFAYRTAPKQFAVLFSETTEWKRVERAMQEAQSRLLMVLNNAPVIVFSFDPDGVLTLSEGKGLEGLGLRPGELVGKSLFDLYGHDQRWVELVRKALSGKSAAQLFEGEQMALELLYQPVLDADGAVVSVSGVAIDCTDRMLARKALHESEERLRILVQCAPAGVAMLDHNLRYIAHSRRWLTDYQLGDQDLMGRHHYEVFPEIPERWKEIHRRCLTGVAERCDEDRFERADGSVDYLRWELQPWRTPQGDVGGLVFFTEMITERVLAQAALRESRERLAEAQQIAHLGNWNWDCATDEITWSDEVYRIFGHPVQSFRPRYETDFLAAVHPEDRETIHRATMTTMQTGKPYKMEHRILWPDGTVRFVREKGALESDTNGRPLRMYGTVQDVTEIRVAEQQMTRLRDEFAHITRVNLVGELAAGIAHELNQPLAAMANYSFALRSTLQRQLPHPHSPEMEECLTIAQALEDQAVRAGDIIRKLQGLMLRGSTERLPVRIGRLVADVTQMLSSDLQSARIELEVEVPETLPLVNVDAVQIQQVLLNLCRNAIEAQRDFDGERRLQIAATRNEPEWVIVSVRDWGPGLADDIRDELFSPFITSRDSGMGFGLPISRRIIEAHGGRLWFTPDIRPGAEFCCSLPVELSQ